MTADLNLHDGILVARVANGYTATRTSLTSNTTTVYVFMDIAALCAWLAAQFEGASGTGVDVARERVKTLARSAWP